MTQPNSRLSNRFIRWQTILALGALFVVVLVAYANALKLGFYGDDWIFYELAVRLSWTDYLVKYFDPRVQTAWFRPLHGILYKLNNDLFGTNAQNYHLANLVFHLVNCFLLYAILRRVTRNERLSFVAALVFAALPTAAQSIFWPGVIDSLVALFCLLAIWGWYDYLAEHKLVSYWLAVLSFLHALMTKEIGVALPILLFLLDWFVISKRVSLAQLVRRYVPFVLVWLVYLPIEFYIVTNRSVFISREGYSAGARLFTNLIDYLATLAFPWVFAPPFSYVWLALVAIVLAFFIGAQKIFGLIPILASMAFAILPVVPFPFVANRFLYTSLIGSAILVALGFEWLWRTFSNRFAHVALLVVLACITVLGSVNIANAADGFGEWARVSRVPFRNVSQAHPAFTENTLLYFVYPPLPGSNLSGMFLWRYGARVTVRATDIEGQARLRDYPTAYVIYFDEQSNQYEQLVEKENRARTLPSLPVTFGDAIRLDGVELASTQVKRGQAVVVFLYWRATKKIDQDYTVSVNLVDANGKGIASYEKAPRRGDLPTSTWGVDQVISDVIILDTQGGVPGAYRLTVGWMNINMPPVIITPIQITD